MSNFSFLDLVSGPQINTSTVIYSLVISFVLGVIISLIYKKTNRGFSYDGSFCFTLIMITIIVNVIMMIIGSNIALSLGLIGSLSIIRFRTAIKNSVDMAFLFWSIATGLAIGAHQYSMALVCVVVISVVILLLSKSRYFTRTNTDYVMIVSLNIKKDQDEIVRVFKKNNLKWEVKSSFFNEDGSEMTYSIYSKKMINIENVLSEINSLNIVKSVSLLRPDTNLYI